MAISDPGPGQELVHLVCTLFHILPASAHMLFDQHLLRYEKALSEEALGFIVPGQIYMNPQVLTISHHWSPDNLVNPESHI